MSALRQLVRAVHALVPRIAARSRDLANQVDRSSRSTAANIAEAEHHYDGNGVQRLKPHTGPRARRERISRWGSTSACSEKATPACRPRAPRRVRHGGGNEHAGRSAWNATGGSGRDHADRGRREEGTVGSARPGKTGGEPWRNARFGRARALERGARPQRGPRSSGDETARGARYMMGAVMLEVLPKPDVILGPVDRAWLREGAQTE